MIRPSELSPRGAAFIGEFEGYRADWYRDPVGVWTIGYGHTGPLPHGFRPPLSRSEAQRLMIVDSARYAAAVSAIRPRIWRQTRFDALVSFSFNLGAGIFAPERSIGQAVRRRIGRGDAVPTALLLYDKAGGRPLPGLTRRRLREARLWTSGRYEA